MNLPIADRGCAVLTWTLRVALLAAPFNFKDTKHAANLFALAELGNIYTRLMNPTTDVVEKRVSLLEGAPELGGCAVASGTSANFYAIINCAKMGDNFVSARNLYGGTYTMFADILPTMGITCNFVDSQDPANFAAAIDDKTRCIFCEVSRPHDVTAGCLRYA